MARKYLIETFGCQMNFHDSERMAGLLEQAGYEATTEEADADLVVINTCSVRERAEEKLFTRLGKLRGPADAWRQGPAVAVTGCVAQQEGAAILARAPHVDVIVGTRGLTRLPMLVDRAAATHRPQVDLAPHDDVSFPLGIARRVDPVKAYVTIIEGCNEYCSFCVVPYTRGHERMRPLASIVSDVREAADSGRKEIQLLGQIVNHYEAPDRDNCDFAALLEVIQGVEGVERIRFASPHPRYITARLIAAVRDLPKVCKHLHLPVQSGSTEVLRAMRRRYTRDEYLDLVHAIRAAIPGIALSTDMIVGFPGETDEAFADTLSLTEAVRYHSMFSFKYSPRPNTLASHRMPETVDERTKTSRIVALQALQRQIQCDLHAHAVGSTELVLVDAVSRRRACDVSGRTSGNTVVNFPGSADWLGTMVRVRITRAGPHSLSGDVVGVPA